jgi:predicted amidohydrolase YtcJ
MRIEHASILTEDTIRDIRENGIVISSQPVFLESEHSWLQKRLGFARVHQTYPFHSCFEHDIMLAGASDAPVESTNVLHAIGISMHRYGFVSEESISIDQALRMFTINAAIVLCQDHLKGSIESNKYADFVILDQNPLKYPPLDIEKIRILATFKRGQLIYSKLAREDLFQLKNLKK